MSTNTVAKQPRRPLYKPVRGVIWAGLIGALAFACGVALTATSGWLIVRASERPVILTLLVAIVAVRTFGIGRPVFRYVERLVSHNAALADLTERRTDAYRQLVPLTPARLGGRRRADLLSGVVRDLDDEVDVQVRVIVPLMTTVIATATVVICVFALNVDAGWVVLAAAIASALVGWIDLALERQGQKASLRARGQIDRVAHLVSANASELAAIGAAGEPMRWLEHAQANVEKASRQQARGRAVGAALALIVTGVATVVMATILDSDVQSGALEAPVAALLLLTPLALGDVIGLIPDAVGALARSSAARDRLQNLLSATPAVRDTGTGELAPSTDPPALELRGVEASWLGDTVDAGPLNLTFAPGGHVALTGPNGSGKSTALAVIARHLDPKNGEYLLNGTDARELPLDDVRALIAFADDEPHVFAGTLRANLRLAKPDATDAECVTALREAGLGDWLASLPEGLDTELGEYRKDSGELGQRSISGGERARLAMARVLLSRRPIVLLDEPVAHLDGPTADAVIRDLLAASAGRTVIMVSHHPVAFDALDDIVEFEPPKR